MQIPNVGAQRVESAIEFVGRDKLVTTSRLLTRIHAVFTAVIVILATVIAGGPPAAAATNIDFHTISQGSRGINVEAAQELLNYRGFNVGKPDGAFGQQTDKAVKSFQRSNRLGNDGEVGPNTWRRLVVPITDTTTGGHVKALTILLDKFDGKGAATTYGPITTGRVRDFQAHVKIGVDGDVGPTTWRYLVFQYVKPVPSETGLCKGLSGKLDTANYKREGWGTPAAAANLERAGDKVYQRYGSRVAFRDMSLEQGGAFPLVNGSRQHNTHRRGMDVDLRLMSTTEIQCSQPMTYRSSRYSQTRTSALIDELGKSSESLGGDQVDIVLFNDPTLIRRYPEVRYARGHDDHLHVRFCTEYYPYDRNYNC